MKRKWSHQEIVDGWSLGSSERSWVTQRTETNRLGFAVLLKAFDQEGRFPRSAQEVPFAAVEHIVSQLAVDVAEWSKHEWTGRTFELHRARIRQLLGYREATGDDYQVLQRWLIEEVLEGESKEARLREIPGSRG